MRWGAKRLVLVLASVALLGALVCALILLNGDTARSGDKPPTTSRLVSVSARCASFDNRVTSGCFSPDATSIESCLRRNRADQLTCYAQAFGNVSYTSGPRVALTDLERRYRAGDDRDLAAACHLVTHAVGAAALRRYRGDSARAFGEGTEVCAAGYYHGVLLFALAQSGQKDLGTVARTLCTKVAGAADNPDGALQNCAHATGHGLLINGGYDTLPGVLTDCERLYDATADRSCRGGAFMENLASFYGFSTQKSSWVRLDDPIYPCNAVAGRFRGACWIHHSTRLLAHTRNNYGAAAELCRSVEATYVDDCYRSIGHAIGNRWRTNPAGAIVVCERTGKGETPCIDGVATFLAQQDPDGSTVNALCALLSGAQQSDCRVAAARVQPVNLQQQ